MKKKSYQILYETSKKFGHIFRHELKFYVEYRSKKTAISMARYKFVSRVLEGKKMFWKLEVNHSEVEL